MVYIKLSYKTIGLTSSLTLGVSRTNAFSYVNDDTKDSTDPLQCKSHD